MVFFLQLHQDMSMLGCVHDVQNDKLSVLSNTIEYIRELKGQVTTLQKPPRIISSSLQQNLTNPVQAAAPTVAAPGPSTSCNPIINSNTNTSSVVVSVEVGGGSSTGELIIKVQAPKNPHTQTLIQILTQMQDLELEIGSLSYDLSTNDHVHISLSVLVNFSTKNLSNSEENFLRTNCCWTSSHHLHHHC